METYVIENRKTIGSIGKYFNQLEWLYRAMSKDETRRNISVIHVDNGIYFATDGSRLHVVSPDIEELPNTPEYNLPDGDYKFLQINKKQIILQKEDDIIYPDVWSILAYKPRNGIRPMIIARLDKKDYRKANLNRLIFHIISKTYNMFDINLIDDAMFEGEIHFEQYSKNYGCQNPDMSPIIMGNCDQFAVVMPLKKEA